MRRLLLLSLLLIPTAHVQEPPADPTDLANPEKHGRLTLTLDPGGHTAQIRKVFFTPDSKQVLTASKDHTVRAWDVQTGEPRYVLHPPGVGGILVAALAPDGKRLAVASRHGDGAEKTFVAYVMTLPDGRIERVLRGHTKEIIALAFSPDGKRLASASDDNTVRLYDLDKDDAGKVLVTKKFSPGLAFSPDGTRLARAGIGKAKGEILDLATGKSLATIDGRHVAWSPDGKALATVGGQLQVFDAAGNLLWKIDKKGFLAVVFTPDSRTVLASRDPGNHVQPTTLYAVATGKEEKVLTPPPGHATTGLDIAVSTDGRRALTGGGKETHEAIIWDLAGGQVHRQLAARSWIGGGSAYPRAAWSADGKVLSWDNRRKKPTFRLSDLRLGPTMPAGEVRGPIKQQGTLTLARAEYNRFEVTENGKHVADLKRYATITCATFAGAGQVAMGSRAGALGLFDARTGKLLQNFEAHQLEVYSIAPSPDGRFLASISIDQTLKIFRMDREKPLLTLYVNGPDWIAWTPEGYYAATPRGEQLMGWKVDNGIGKAADYYPAEQFRKQLFRPDVIRLVLEKGGVAEALKAVGAAPVTHKAALPEASAGPEKLLPPSVTLAVVDQSKLPTIKLKVAASEAVPEQPIKSLRLLVDGLPLPGRKAFVSFPAGQEKKQYEETWEVELPPGKHALTVLARSKDDTPGQSVEIKVNAPLPASQRPVLHHVAVGIDHYDQRKLELTCARADAELLAQAFREVATTSQLFQSAPRTRTLLDADATRDAVLRAIEEVHATAKPTDRFILSFAGHGRREGGEFYLLTKEADDSGQPALEKTAISGTVLRQRLADFPCPVLMLLDACRSGAFANGGRGPSEEAARALSDVDVRVTVMCAALGHEEAQEDRGHGLFTRAVARALRRDPKCFYDVETGELTVYHLQAFVAQEVAKDSDYKQNPFLKMPFASPPLVVAQFATRPSGDTNPKR